MSQNLPSAGEVGALINQSLSYPEGIQGAEEQLIWSAMNLYKAKAVIAGLAVGSATLAEIDTLLDQANEASMQAAGSLRTARESANSYLEAIGLGSLCVPEAHVGREYNPLLDPLFQRDRILHEQFRHRVGGLDFRSLAVVPAGRKLPRSIDEFRLVPIMPRRGSPHSLASMDVNAFDMPEGVYGTYTSPAYGGKPVTDARLVIGLVRGDWLVAVAGGGIDHQGALRIVQLQDVTGKAGKNTPENPKGKYKTGLHDGFLWRDTLVNAWAEVGRLAKVGDTLVIQSGKNNRWPAVRAVGDHPGYDGVARRMGFIQDGHGNWARPLA